MIRTQQWSMSSHCQTALFCLLQPDLRAADGTVEYDSHVQVSEERTIMRWITYQEIIFHSSDRSQGVYARLVVHPVMIQKRVRKHELPDPISQKMVTYQTSDKPIVTCP